MPLGVSPRLKLFEKLSSVVGDFRAKGKIFQQ